MCTAVSFVSVLVCVEADKAPYLAKANRSHSREGFGDRREGEEEEEWRRDGTRDSQDQQTSAGMSGGTFKQQHQRERKAIR